MKTHIRWVVFWFCRMDDKGEVKCIKFSLGNKILAVQRTSKSVVSVTYIWLYICIWHSGSLWNVSFLFFRISRTSFLIIRTWNSPTSARYIPKISAQTLPNALWISKKHGFISTFRRRMLVSLGFVGPTGMRSCSSLTRE